METGVLLSCFAQQLRRKNADIPGNYFTLIDAAGISPNLVPNQNAWAQERQSWVPFKSGTSAIAQFPRAGWCCVWICTQFSETWRSKCFKDETVFTFKTLLYKVFSATLEFTNLKAFARFKDQIWCMDPAYVDKLAKDSNGAKYLPVHQDLFDWTVDAKGMKTKVSKETVRAILTMFTKRNRFKKTWVDKGTKNVGQFKKICKAEGIQTYFATCKTLAAFAEQTIHSLKKILHRYMEDYGYKCSQKLPQIVTTLRNRKKIVDRLDINESYELQLIVHSVQQATTII